MKLKRKIKKSRILIVLILLSFLLGILLIPNSPTEGDSIGYANELRSFVEGNYLLSSFSYHKPLFMFFNYISYKFLNAFNNVSFLFAIAFTSVVFGSLSILLVFNFVKHLTKRDDVALVSVFLFSFSPFVLWFKSFPLSEITSLFFVLLSFVLLFFYEDNSKMIYLVLSLFVCGLSLLVRFSNIFFIPMYSLYFFYILYIKKKLKLFPLIICFLLPIGIYVFVISTFIRPDFQIINFFSVSSQHISGLKNMFNFEIWIAHLFQIINGFTLTSFVLVFGGFFILLKNAFYKNTQKGMLTKEDSLKLIFFSLFWCFPSLFYYAAIMNPLLRYEINLLPILILLASLSIFHFRQFNRIYLYILFSLSILFDLLINYLPISEYYYGGSTLHSIFSFFVYFDLVYVIFSLIIIFVVYTYVKKKVKKIKKLSFIVIIIIIMILHALPVSMLLIKQTHYMHSIASWYGENVPSDSTIIAGKEASFDYFFMPSSNIIEYRGLFYKYSSSSETDLEKSIVIQNISSSLDSNKSVYISTDVYLKDLVEYLKSKNNFNLNLKKIIPSEKIRSQYDPAGVFMNYASLIKSEDIYIYEINKNVNIENI